MGINDRKARQQEEIKQQIIAESWHIIAEEGWQALSIRRIADAIEYSVPVIYKHFENKEAIQEYFIKDGFAKLTEEMRQIQTASDDERIREIAYSYWRFAASRTAHYRIMFSLGIPHCETVNSVAEMKQMSDMMRVAIEKLAQSHRQEHTDIYLKLKTFWSMLHGFISIELLSNTVIPAEPTPVFKDAIESFMYTLINKK
ncbi:TetR/AcrR family transcriptional regulator [Sphingobacterium griseoflavum]|uniref:TetR family transcriptional regulator n=1 Tax=Sphingobacterium griseoflavum TaxID=1474952 RepID=A0ABQ3I0T6_9SPHI|nr:TetR/AcrR family transcriptional regulator [Sphingobacterium griseoflavum]GHE45055.1 TetR family transcriptional regulator [Sphingobacterium griseoflavum]